MIGHQKDLYVFFQLIMGSIVITLHRCFFQRPVHPLSTCPFV